MARVSTSVGLYALSSNNGSAYYSRSEFYGIVRIIFIINKAEGEVVRRYRLQSSHRVSLTKTLLRVAVEREMTQFYVNKHPK